MFLGSCSKYVTKSVDKIVFYEDENGYSDVMEFIMDLNNRSKTDKNARINRNKITAYLDLLMEMGTRIGEPVTKHLEGEIWELKPLANRILYAYFTDDTFVVLSHFVNYPSPKGNG